MMQLLKRVKKQGKYTLWIGNSKNKVDEDSITEMNFDVTEKIWDFYDIAEAKFEFEKKFLDQT